MNILPLNSSSNASLELVGGKGLNLARLAQAGFPVPDGFLISTDAYRTFTGDNELAAFIMEAVNAIATDDPIALQTASATIRERFSTGTIAPALAEEIVAAYRPITVPVAVRSSATAEDLPDASFAGQQDTFLNVVGEEALLTAVIDCWSSLWTARAIGYRARNAIPNEEVALCVVVQAMVQSEASGVLFTANPLNGRRTEIVIDATLGLGEALVAGQVEPDHYVISATDEILSKTLGAKALSIRGQAGGGVETIHADGSDQQAIPDEVILELGRLGRKTAVFYTFPEDIEWAWADGRLHLLQSRPITSLFPLPEDMKPDPLYLLFSFGAVQGMLDPMTPLGRDAIMGIFAAAARSPFGYKDVRLENQHVFYEAGERLWADMTSLVRHPMGRKIIKATFPLIEPGAAESAAALWDDPRLQPERRWFRFSTFTHLVHGFAPMFWRLFKAMIAPEKQLTHMQQLTDQALVDLAQQAKMAVSLQDRVALFESMLDYSFPVVIPWFVPTVAGGMAPFQLLNKLAKSVDKDALILTRGLPHNVTTEMDLALWQTAQHIKADKATADWFARTPAEELAAEYMRDSTRMPAAVGDFLTRYGMRGLAEIDIGRPRWREEPTPIFQSLQSYLQIDDPDRAPDLIFGRGAEAAEAAIDELETAVRQTRFGRLKAFAVRKAAFRLRTLAGLRESPKFLIIRLFGIVREELLASGRELVAAGTIARPDDLFFLRLAELQALAAGEDGPWMEIINGRRAVYDKEKRRRQIPRLLLSDGQAFYEGMGASDNEADGVFSGSPVSPGVVEGRVRVIFNPYGAKLEPGEILVCPGTDPSWTPLFLAAGGLVMEVGGLMTHGSVVAREYGIPAVVGVHEATSRLQTGQLVRVDGSAGKIEIIEDMQPREE